MENFKEWIDDKYINIVDNKISAKSVRLTEEQENELFDEIRANNDVAKGLVFLIYQRCIDAVLSENSSKLNSRLERQEYLDEGVDIVLNSINKFDTTKGVRFITYLTRNLENLIERVNRRHNMHVRSVNQNAVSLFDQITSNKVKNESELLYSESLSSGDYEESERKFQSEYLIDKLLEFVPDRNGDILLKNYGIGCDEEMSYVDIANSSDYRGKIKKTQVANLGKKALMDLQDMCGKIIRINKQLLLGEKREELALSNRMSVEEIDYYVKVYNYIFNAIGTKPEYVTVKSSKNTKDKKIRKENTRIM